MQDALTVGAELQNYYQFREEQDDSGYLHELVKTCQRVLGSIEHYDMIKPYLLERSSR